MNVYFFIFTVVLFFSGSVVAHTCQVALHDSNNRAVRNFRSSKDFHCQQAMAMCYDHMWKKKFNPDYYQCYLISKNEDIQDTEKPRFEHRQLGMDESLQDFKRPIKVGETVIFEETLWVTTEAPVKDFYNLKPKDGGKRDIRSMIPRNEISLTRSCSERICTKTAVISRNSSWAYAVEGVSFDGSLILQEPSSKTYFLDVNPSALATTSGCLHFTNRIICTGVAVSRNDNRNYEVLGITGDNKLVLRKQSGDIIFDVDPGSVSLR